MGYAKNGLETHFQRYSRYRLQAIIRQGQSSRSNQEDIVSWRVTSKKNLLLHVPKSLFNHVWDVLKDVPSFQSEYGVILRYLLEVTYYRFHIRKRVYSELCFKRCGDRVKNWITFNEPYTYVTGGYVRGEMAPGRCSSWQNLNCTAGDSGVEPYLVAHHQLLSHAAAVMKYKEKYQESQKSKIGITLVAQWVIPFSKEIIQRRG
ncbi:cyanogenic beta-glucosidase-like isoform X3 [Primulina eburnea]|uniref:cyanogenic beta-glucosidase-like isoform X3 n=1 Tax=Primulina eburnea TaxID=1245227 RepID=UPI003C6C7AC2